MVFEKNMLGTFLMGFENNLGTILWFLKKIAGNFILTVDRKMPWPFFKHCYIAANIAGNFFWIVLEKNCRELSSGLSSQN